MRARMGSYGVKCTDMCPFRASRMGTLARLHLREKTYDWTLEMQMHTAKIGLNIFRKFPSCIASARVASPRLRTPNVGPCFVAGWKIIARFAQVVRGGTIGP